MFISVMLFFFVELVSLLSPVPSYSIPTITPPQLSANGVVGAKYSFDESYDGGSCLRFTGVLNEKVTASFPLFR